MKITLPLFVLFFSGIESVGQTYISLAPCITNEPGTFLSKSNIALEIGRQWDVFSLGIDFGKTSLAKISGQDTTNYLELRPNLGHSYPPDYEKRLEKGLAFVLNHQPDTA